MNSEPTKLPIIGHLIPVDPSCELKAGAWVQHRVLTVVWSKDVDGAPIKGLRFRVHDPKQDGPKPDLNRYISTILKYEVAHPFVDDTPWDISLPDPDPSVSGNPARFLIVQLDNAIDWEFTPNLPGVTSKSEYIRGNCDGLDCCWEDCNLHYVDQSGSVSSGPGAPPGCRIVYWSVLKRPINEARGFNFFIDFIDSESGKRLPTLIDPNVPDGGGAEIP